MREQQKRIIDIFERERAIFKEYVHWKAIDLSYMDEEDILADVFFNLFNKADISIHIENFTAYIFRCIANKIADYRRRNLPAISLDAIDPVTETPFGDLLTDPTAGIARVLQQKDIQERLYAAVGRLEPRQRAVWMATEIEGRTFKELAVMWDEPIGTLLSRKSRAVKALQAMLMDLREDD